MTAIRRALRLSGWTAALLCVTAVGCGKKPKPVDVTGKVVFFGARPKAPLLISLHPQEDANKLSTPSALIDGDDGSFKLEKCLPGRYKATVALVPVQVGGGPPGAPGATPGFPAASGIPPIYMDAQTSPWDVIVPEAGKDGLVLRGRLKIGLCTS